MKKTVSLITVFAVIFTLFSTSLGVQAATEVSKAGRVAISSGRLNVRKSASKTSDVIYTLKKDGFVTLIQKSGDWWRVEYAENKYGYCHSDYIKSVDGRVKRVKLTSGTLNVRSGGGASYSRIDGLANGKTVIELKESNGWSRILFKGTKTGYVSSKYLEEVKSSSVYPLIRLKVPSYKQYDNRWASVKIGTSGKTIAQIGCATTAIAMIESYRRGKEIYPDAMAKELKYTPSGNVYWPEDYTVVTSKSGYLKNIYSVLKKGKPVLLGSKNSYGSQHWIVITGYNGGDTLSTEGFTVNDPGSKVRKNLKSFLTDYPNFYKYFYY